MQVLAAHGGSAAGLPYGDRGAANANEFFDVADGDADRAESRKSISRAGLRE